MTENKELLPCPFCGRPAEYKDPRNRYAGCTSESLEECIISGTAFKVLVWNTRAESQKLDIAVRALETTNNNLIHLVEKCLMFKDMEFVEQYYTAIGQAKSALQQIKE